MTLQSTKVLDGYSCCFRDYNSRFNKGKIYGGAISFRLWFEGRLDDRNWIVDFGFLKRSKYKVTPIDYEGNELEPMSLNEYFDWLFDHTMILSENDPYMLKLKYLAITKEAIQLRLLPDTGVEYLTQYVFDLISKVLEEETNGRCWVSKIEGNLQEFEKYTIENGK